MEIKRRAEEKAAIMRRKMAAMEKEKAETIAYLRRREQRDDAMIEDAGGAPRKEYVNAL